MIQNDVLFARSERFNQKHFHILQYLREHGVQTPVIISAQEANLDDARRALLEGAAGVMLPTESDEELIATVRKTLFHRTRNPECNVPESAKVGEADLEVALPPSVSIQIGTPLFESERMMIMNTLAAIGNKWMFFWCLLLPPIMIAGLRCSGSLSTIRNGVDYIVMETASNGHLIRLVGARDSKESVSVVRSPGNWLLLTINDVDVDLARIRRLKPSGAVTKVDITLFESAVQIGFRFSGQVSSFEIVEDRSGNDLLISVFLGPS